ncbi:MAG: DUF465 domain-containing protein [Deltaproteobacteria bacterium]|nr:DUF465 domain-containing protein [Deltaproteobacteria bacterium]
MENRDELVKKLLREDAEFKKSYKAHKDFEEKIAKIDRKKRMTPEDEVERNRLKKLKLALKDGMEKRLSEYQAKSR